MNKSRSKKEVLFPLERIGNSDVFEGLLHEQKKFLPTSLKLLIITEQYTNFMTLTAFSNDFEESLYLFNEGKDRFIHNKLGANFITVDGISGISFSFGHLLLRVSVVGDFNFWDGRSHMMRGLALQAFGKYSSQA